jgi:hypothetical protein
MSKVLRKLGIGFITFILCSPQVYAIKLPSSFVATLSMGAGWEHANQAQTLNLAPDIIKTYTANHSTNSLPLGEIFLGIRHPLARQWEGQIGLAFMATGNAKLSGDIWDDADPAFNNYTYKYKVKRTALDLKGKLSGPCYFSFIPWVSAALGLGWNKAYDFSSTPTIFEAVQTPGFSSKTTTALTYTLGIGIQRQLNTHWQVGAGYEFSNWGKVKLGNTPAENTDQKLSLSHFYTNSILVNLTYIA